MEELTNEIKAEFGHQGLATLFVDGFAMALVALLCYDAGSGRLDHLGAVDWIAIFGLLLGIVVAKRFQVRFYRSRHKRFSDRRTGY